jgi:hypothetical protein
LTADAQTANLADPGIRAQAALSSWELTELIKRIPALKQVMILDTCASGQLIEKLTERRNVQSSQIRAMERMKDRTGMHVLAGCAADAVSYETSRYGQGLLTHSLLLGMRGAALRDEEFVDVGRLFGFAADKVPELAKDIGGIQRPEIARPKGGASFDVGQLNSEDKAQIPLQPVLPLVLRSSFQDEHRFRDHLNLAKHVDDLLRDASSRGRDADLVFIDAGEFPGACGLLGRYSVQGQTVTVVVVLARGEENLEQFRVTGQISKVDRLANEIVVQTRKRLNPSE